MKTIGIVQVDQEDMQLLRQSGWYVNKAGYVVREESGRKVVRLHRIILGAADGQIVDHINGDKLDNRKQNLRIADKSTNGMNRGAQSNSKTGVKGVSWSKQKNKFRITCNVMGKQYHLGYAKTIEEAKSKYAERIEKYHGGFARCV